MQRNVFVTGGTGYLGRALIERLVARGHAVTALARPGSEARLPRGARTVLGAALAQGQWFEHVPRGCVFVHLIGTAHPAPWKAREFERVDLASVGVALQAARRAHCAHFVYLSVARPAPLMRAYQALRAEGERRVAAAFDRASFVRPWYVLGPGHRWPAPLLPLYALAERVPALRDGARRLGLVRLSEFSAALVAIVEREPDGCAVFDVPAIRELARAKAS
ncbi:MAG: NAD(P)H-binding protein [Planctomycetes bacterium]|nr:NAD(P)H-binding protein [Planctomycetota bacterium]